MLRTFISSGRDSLHPLEREAVLSAARTEGLRERAPGETVTVGDVLMYETQYRGSTVAIERIMAWRDLILTAEMVRTYGARVFAPR